MERCSKLLAMVVIVATLASCGIFRKTKHKQRHEIEEVSKQESVSVEKSTTKGEVKERSVDKGTVVTERTTTSVTERGGKSRVTIGKGDLKPGENYLKDSAGNQIKAVLDTLGKTLMLEITTSPEKTTETISETITDNRDRTTDREERQEKKQERQVAVSVDSTRRESASESSSESKPSFWGIIGGWIGVALAVVLILVVLLWWFGVKRKK